MIHAKKILVGALALVCSAHADNRLHGRSFFSQRSQGTNAARDLAGWRHFLHQADAQRWYAGIAITPGFSDSFRPIRIAEALFATNTLNLSGSQVIDRDPNDLLADYFGLSTTFKSSVNVNPRISNGFSIFDGFFAYPTCHGDFYCRLHIPLVSTHWDLRLSERICQDSNPETPFPALYMAPAATQPGSQSFVESLKGATVWGQMQTPLAAGKVNGKRCITGVADMHMVIGWDVVSDEEGFFGFNLRVVAPTGSRPDSEYLFEPILGNGKHWEMGVGLEGRVMLWETEWDKNLAVYMTANITHLFKSRQRRSFDFCQNGFLSRYMLLKKFNDTSNYTDTLVPAINITTLSCDVYNTIQTDIVFMFAYNHCGFIADIGYNGWFRSTEKINLNECIAPKTYGIKGIQNTTTAGNMPSTLTQNSATIHGNPFADQNILADPNSPVFISTEDINVRSAASPRVLTHKIFTYLGYEFNHHKASPWARPFLGVGGEIEFEGLNERFTDQVYRNTLSQWSLWIKAGAAFD